MKRTPPDGYASERTSHGAGNGSSRRRFMRSAMLYALAVGSGGLTACGGGSGDGDDGAGVRARGSGQGRALVEEALPYQFKARTSCAPTPDGVHCTTVIPVSASDLADSP